MGFLNKLKKGINSKESKKVKKCEEKKKDNKPKIKNSDFTMPEAKEVKEEPQTEGELAIDVYESNGDIVIQSTIGGIKAEDLDISIEGDMVTVRGSREK